VSIQPPRTLFGALLTLAVAASLIHLWLCFFSLAFTQVVTGGLAYLFGLAGVYGLLPRWIPRHERSPERILRWNALIALIGLAHSLLWHVLAALPTNPRFVSLISGVASVGLLWQIVFQSAFVAYLVLMRPTRLKLTFIYGYYGLTAAVLLIFLVSRPFGALIVVLLWAYVLPLIYFTQDAWASVPSKNRSLLFLLLAAVIALFFGSEVFPRLFSEAPTPLSFYLNGLAMGLVIFHGGLLLVPFLGFIGLQAPRSQQLLGLLTTFLEKQQKQETTQGILTTTQAILQELSSVARVHLRLRNMAHQPTQMPKVIEFLLQHLRQVSPQQTHIQTLANVQVLAKGLPAVSAIVAQRPITSLQGPLPMDALQVVVLGAEEDSFEPNDVSLVATLIEQTALFLEALDRRSYHEERLLSRKEIDFLKETREALLPPVPPILQKVQYHVVFQQHDKTIGGDYYQIEEVEPEKVVDFWLSDCAGSGIAAAYQMAQARAVLNALWQEKLSPDELLLRLNDALRRVFHKNNFIAATYLRIDLATRVYTLYRPGNPEILYWDPQKKQVELLRPAGVVLGNTSSTLVKRILEKYSAPLIPGATWLFFSDGFTEATNLQGEQFGIERLVQLFEASLEQSPAQIAQTILQAVQAFVGDTHLGDDGTLIVIRYQS